MNGSHPFTHPLLMQWEMAKHFLSLSLPQMSATLPSIHPIPSWALPHKPSFIEKPALASLPEFLYLLQSALLPAPTDTIDTLYTPLFLLNSALHVFELNLICHFMHEHHGTLFSFLHSALDLALLNNFFPTNFPAHYSQSSLHPL